MILIIFFILCLLLIFCNYSDILFSDKDEYEFNVYYEEYQKEVDSEIYKYVLDKDISFNNPKIMLNPYGKSLLSALVIFYTDYLTDIKLYVNDVYMTTVESSNSHIIPVYGLRLNYNNKIVIENNLGEKQEVYIQTGDILIKDFYSYKTSNSSNEYLFLNSSNGKFAIDNDGYISWYMDFYKMPMGFSNEKKLYILDFANRIIEMDFMGRVNKSYFVNLNNDSHEIKKLKNGNIMYVVMNGSIYEIDSKTGKIVLSLNIEDVLKKIDEDFDLDTNVFYTNYFQYDEDRNTLLVSIRGLNAIVNIDLNTEEILWIFSDDSSFSNKFDKYKLNLVSGDYFKGQHTPYIDGKYLYVFDNNNFSSNGIDFSTGDKSYAVIYEIDGMNIKEVYRYGDVYLSGWYGNFYVKDNIKHINYGSIINDETGTYSKIVEYDDKYNIITDFKTKFNSLLIYQSFRDSFYDDVTSNYEINVDFLEYTDLVDYDRDKFMTYNGNSIKNYFKFKNEIENSIVDETMLVMTEYGFEFDMDSDFEILFIDKNYNFYNMKNVEKTEYLDSKYFSYITYLSGLKGKYAIYFKVNNKYYNPNMVINLR